MEKLRVCAGITFYNPTNDDVNNVIKYSEFLSQIYIYDNSEPKSNYEILRNKNIEILSYGENNGLSKACHDLCTKAQMNEFDYIILFDQDSRMSLSDIQLMVSYMEDDSDRADIYSPQIVFNNQIEIKKDKKVEKIKWCITSGSMINLHNYNVRYRFDDNYFIDALDKDLCKQIINSNGVIKRINLAKLYQNLGEISVYGRMEHKPFRHYYISRNRLYYNKKYHVNNLISFLQIIRHILLVFLNESDKLEKLKMIFLGISDYKDNKMGKYPY